MVLVAGRRRVLLVCLPLLILVAAVVAVEATAQAQRVTGAVVVAI